MNTLHLDQMDIYTTVYFSIHDRPFLFRHFQPIYCTVNILLYFFLYMLLGILNNHIHFTISNSSASYARNHLNFSSDVDLYTYHGQKFKQSLFLVFYFLFLNPKEQQCCLFFYIF